MALDDAGIDQDGIDAAVKSLAGLDAFAARVAGVEPVEPDSAVVRYRVPEPYTPHVHDCGYTLGLLSQVPVLFGQPPATVRHCGRPPICSRP